MRLWEPKAPVLTRRVAGRGLEMLKVVICDSWGAVLVCAALLLMGCGSGSKPTATASNRVRVGYIGLTCEAPIFTAYEKGFFKEEGLDVTLVKCEWANYKDVLALGRSEEHTPELHTH